MKLALSLLLVVGGEWRTAFGSGREIVVAEEPASRWTERAGSHLDGRSSAQVFRLSVSGPSAPLKYSQGPDAASSDLTMTCGASRTKPFLYAVLDAKAKLPSGEPVPLFSIHGGSVRPDGRHQFDGPSNSPLFLFFEPPLGCAIGDRTLILRLSVAGEERQVFLKLPQIQ